jgi:hypothetical protein
VGRKRKLKIIIFCFFIALSFYFLNNSFAITRNEIINIASNYIKTRPVNQINITSGITLTDMCGNQKTIQSATQTPGDYAVLYKWGGYSGISSVTFDTDCGYFYDEGLNVGKYAGDVITTYPNGEKACGSCYAVGVDCSGFVSQSWELGFKYSTIGLSYISAVISWVNAENLQPGDIINYEGSHVRLFDSFSNGGTLLNVYEATISASPPSVVFSQMPRGENNYLPRRYYEFINIGERIKTIADLSVRETPGGNLIDVVPTGTTGTIIDGPEFEYAPDDYLWKYVWWYIQYDNGVEGWSVIRYLEILSGDTDTIPPTVDAFDVTPRIITLGNVFTIYYNVSDTGGSGLKQVELWRATDTDGDGEPDWPTDPDGYIDIHYLSGETSYFGSFLDAPSEIGTYWYGIHVVDNAGNWSVEPDPPGPIQVTVIEMPSCPSLYFWNGNDYERRGWLFPGAMPRKNEYRDHIPLNHLVLKDGQYYLQIRETEPENSFIDMSKLIIVDHSADVDIRDFFMDRKSELAPHTRTYEMWYNSNIAVDALKENSISKVLSPLTAIHSVIGDVRPQLRSADNVYVRMRTGDIITLTFPYLPLQDEIRDFIFVGEGFYVPIIPGDNQIN